MSLIVRVLVGTVIAMCGIWAAEKTEARPNVILCMTDDQGWGDTGYNGLTKIKTPALDSMAANGLRFDRFYAAAPVCSPTRASVLSGRHPFRSGVFSPGSPWRTQELTLAEVLKSAGYATGHFGKWHLNGISGPGKPLTADDPLGPARCGFDEWLSVSNFFEGNWEFGHNGTPKKTVGDGSDVIVAQALEWITAQTKHGKPFLAVVWFGNPHTPHLPTASDLAAAGGDKYYGELLGVDRAMGTLRAGLRTLGVADQTMVWFNSDNGADKAGSNGTFRGKKNTVYEGGLRVPGILEWPKRIKPSHTAIPVCTSDIYPTVLAAAGITVTEQVLPLDGISLMPLVDGVMTERPRPIGFWNRGGQNMTSDQGNAAWSDNRFKLHKFSDKNAKKPTYELYDLLDDPKESRDLAKEKPEITAKMKAELEAWQESVLKSLRGQDYQ